jgi:hypothetical protein
MTLAKNYVASPLRSAWRLLPARTRSYLYTRGFALLGPAIAGDTPSAHGGIAVAGELSVATGLGDTNV